MNTKQKKTIIIATMMIIITSCLVTYHLYLWLRTNPIWQVEGISFSDKFQIAYSTSTNNSFFGQNMINQIYFLKANKDVTFVVIVEDRLFEGYKQELYYKGNLVSWVFSDEKPKNKNFKISLFNIINTKNGHYWLLRLPEENSDLLMWCDSKYSKFSFMYTETVVQDIIKYGAVYTSRRGKDKLLLVALNSAYTSGDRQSFMLLSDLLLQCDRSKYANLVNRYATRSFSSRERSQNAQSKITEDAVVAYAKQMKAKFKL